MGIERGWWLAFGVWGLVLIFWRPEPPPMYTQVPSVTPQPSGYRIFYDLIEKEVETVTRTLRGADQLKTEDVLVLLRPSDGIDDAEREDLMDWVGDRGGTLVVGYPLWSDSGDAMENLFSNDSYPVISSWKDKDTLLQEVSYLPVNVESPRNVEPFKIKLQGEMLLGGDTSEALVMGSHETVLVSIDKYGAGEVIQIADSSLLNNESLGFKKSHLLAAALIDEIGRDREWVFDESHEGISVQPALAPLIGAGPFRAAFLHLFLFLLFWYWYKSRRHLPIERVSDERKVREVTTLAADVGRFYFRAKKSRWALSRYVQFFKRKLNDATIGPVEREKAAQLVLRAEQLLSANSSFDAQLQMMKKMAEHQRMLEKKQRDK